MLHGGFLHQGCQRTFIRDMPASQRRRVLNRSRTYFKTKQLIFIILLSIETSFPSDPEHRRGATAIWWILMAVCRLVAPFPVVAWHGLTALVQIILSAGTARAYHKPSATRAGLTIYTRLGPAEFTALPVELKCSVGNFQRQIVCTSSGSNRKASPKR